MDFAGTPSTSKENNPLQTEDLEISSNWKIVNERLLHNTISTVDVTRSPGRAELEDVVSLETCIRLEGNANEKRDPCSIMIKLKNGKKIARIAIVSEAFLIELYKQFGEYSSTAHAEFIDEFEQSAVYFADVCISTPTPELTIKFARLKNPGEPMWLYGIRLSLTESLPKSKVESQFDYNVIGNLLQSKSKPGTKLIEWATKRSEISENEPKNCQKNDMDSLLLDIMSVNINSSKSVDFPNPEENRRSSTRKENLECIGDSKDQTPDSDFRIYIDHKLREMEERLTQRIDTMNCRTNEKLDNIIRLLGDRSH